MKGKKFDYSFFAASPKELVHCGSAVRKRLMVHILNVFVAMPSGSL
jgi:hypothetical protein